MTASFADNEIWHVLIAADDMKRMNVEQLDDAFRLSLVDASTMVWKAGMKQWQSLGLVAGIEDEPETVVRWIEPPPPPRPMPRPAPRPPAPRAPAPRAPAVYQTAVSPVYATPLVAPVYTPQLHAPDPYVLPKRRAAIASEVDFRRASGVRWGRWLVALLLVTGGVLGAYRQNLLRDGARSIGLENKYLSGERRVTAFVAAKAPAPVTTLLTRLALLPGPNAVKAPVAATAALAPVPAAPPPLAERPPEPTTPSPAAVNDPELKTVSLDSLPVLGTEPEAPPSTARAVAPAAAAPRAKAEPPPPANENPLKAAIRSAIAADAAKAKK